MTTPEEPAAPSYRVDGASIRADLPLLMLLALDFLYGLAKWGAMPATVPVHWGLDGTPDGFGPAWMDALLMPAIALMSYALLLFLPLIDPRRANYGLFADTVRFIRWLMVLFLIGLHVVVVRAALGDAIRMDFVVRLAVGLLFCALGNRMGRLRQNFFIGIRVPWTIMSEEVWNRTHRLAGRMWVAGGLALAASSLLPPAAGAAALAVIVVVLVAVPVTYSWWIYQRIAR